MTIFKSCIFRRSLFLLVLAATQALWSADVPSANPNLAPSARAVLEYLRAVSGKHTTAGQHNYPGYISLASERIQGMTGKYPGLWGNDFGFTLDDKDGIAHRPKVIEEAIQQWKRGSLICFTWHAVRPCDDEPNGWKTSVQNKLTDEQWRELITPGSKLYQRWEAQVDLIASYLRQLRDAQVPVLWRPYHEMNGGWFWWGGRPGTNGFIPLWEMMYHRYTRHHRLNNLIWVWNPNAPIGKIGKYAEFFPGLDCVDVLATDVYDHRKTGNPFLPEHYEGLVQLAKGKPVALGEVGTAPPSALFQSQPKWAWFMIWCNFEIKQTNAVREIYASPRVLTLEQLKIRQSKK